MRISVINFSNGKVDTDELQQVIRAVNRQLEEDFAPYWHRSGELRLEGRGSEEPDVEEVPELRGDAVIYIRDVATTDDALGYHALNYRGIPFGFVFLDLCEELDEPWSVTFSHEALELVMDPEVNLLVAGPHPAEPTREVLHWYEMCDAVQNNHYEIDGVQVSDFVLPLYFTVNEEKGGRNHFLGKSGEEGGLESFGVLEGGYVGFYDPVLGQHDSHSRQHDKRAAERRKIRDKAMWARRALRHMRNHAAVGTLDELAEESTATTEVTFFEGFAVEVATQELATAEELITQARDACLDRAWAIGNLDGEPDEFELIPPGHDLTTREVWDLTHAQRVTTPSSDP